jgi:predicted metalloprotease
MNTASLQSRAHLPAHRTCLALLSVVLAAGLAIQAAPAATNGADSAAAKASTDHAVARARALVESSNQFWSQEFNKGGSYTPAQVSFFNRQARGVCGETGALSGPFYCPADMTVYLDRDFIDQVAQRLPGDAADYALAYLIGHAMGQHIQDLVGTTDLVQEARSNSGPALSAKTWMTAELQADCYSGLWMRWAVSHQVVKPVADADAILSAVSAVSTEWQSHLAAGQTMVDPLLTYGTPALRLKWFERGRDSGRFNDCDTFSAGAAGKL